MSSLSEINRPVANIKRDAWFLRFYLWLWKADIKHVDFCRLFWGYVFAIPFLTLKLILAPFFLLYEVGRRVGPRVLNAAEFAFDKLWRGIFRAIKFVARLIPEREQKESTPIRMRYSISPSLPPLPPPKEREPSKILLKMKDWRKNAGQNFLSAVAVTADKGVMAAETAWPVMRVFFIALGAILVVATGILTGYMLFLVFSALGTVLAAIGAAIVWTVVGIGYVASTVWNWTYLWTIPAGSIALIAIFIAGGLFYRAITSKPVAKAADVSADKVLSFGGAMKTGIKSVKYRTCPVIKVVE